MEPTKGDVERMIQGLLRDADAVGSELVGKDSCDPIAPWRAMNYYKSELERFVGPSSQLPFFNTAAAHQDTMNSLFAAMRFH